MEQGTRWLSILLFALLAVVPTLTGRWGVRAEKEFFSMPPTIPKGVTEIEVSKAEVEDPSLDIKYPREDLMFGERGRLMYDNNAFINLRAAQMAADKRRKGNTPDTKEQKEATDPNAVNKESPTYMEKLRYEFVMAMRLMNKLFDKEGNARDTGNERMKILNMENDHYKYEGGRDSNNARSGKGFLIGKSEDDSYIGGWNSNYRQDFGIHITFVAGRYLISAGIHQAGERVCKVPIPCKLRSKLEELKTVPNREVLYRAILVQMPIARCICNPENIMGATTDDDQDKKLGMKPGLIHDEGGDDSTFVFDSTCAFYNGVPEGGAGNRTPNKYPDFKSTLNNSKVFTFSTRKGIQHLCIQLYSLTQLYAPQFKLYAIYRTMNDPANKNKLQFVEIKDCDSEEGGAAGAGVGNGGGSSSTVGVNRIYRTIKTEPNKLYLIEVGVDPVQAARFKEYTVPFKQNGGFMVFFDIGKEPKYYDLFGTAYEASCAGDWKYKIIFNPGARVQQYLPQNHEKTTYLCGTLDLGLAPCLDPRCDALTFYYGQGETSEDGKKRLTSFQIKSGTGNWKGWTTENPKLHYKISVIDEKIIPVINPLKLWLRLNITHRGTTIRSDTVITDGKATDEPPSFTPTFDRSRKFLFHPATSGRYCIILFSCSPGYYPSLRIHSYPYDTEKRDVVTLQPQYNNNTPYYDLCSGEDYIAEVGINSEKTIKVTQSEKEDAMSESMKQRKEAFILVFTTEVKDYFAFFDGRTYHPAPPDKVNYSTQYSIALNPRGQPSTFYKKIAQETTILGVYEPEIAPFFNHVTQAFSFYFPNTANKVIEKLVQPHGVLELRIVSASSIKPNGQVQEDQEGFPHAICPETGITDLLSLAAKASKSVDNK